MKNKRIYKDRKRIQKGIKLAGNYRVWWNWWGIQYTSVNDWVYQKKSVNDWVLKKRLGIKIYCTSEVSTAQAQHSTSTSPNTTVWACRQNHHHGKTKSHKAHSQVECRERKGIPFPTNSQVSFVKECFFLCESRKKKEKKNPQVFWVKKWRKKIAVPHNWLMATQSSMLKGLRISWRRWTSSTMASPTPSLPSWVLKVVGRAPCWIIFSIQVSGRWMHIREGWFFFFCFVLAISFKSNNDNGIFFIVFL